MLISFWAGSIFCRTNQAIRVPGKGNKVILQKSSILFKDLRVFQVLGLKGL